VHNDYLEQFSDSGIPGGVSYALWVGLLLLALGRKVWRGKAVIPFAVFAGLLGWSLQGVGEFSLYIPALGWSAFALLGWLLAVTAKPFDKPGPTA
jgi:O-antigen ligase